MTRATTYELEMLNPFELMELLHAEIEKGSPDFQYIKDLITVGCPIDARDQYGMTALHLAALDGNLEVVEFLVSNGAQPNTRDDWDKTALHVAANFNNLWVVNFLISKGANIHARDNWGRTAWDLATNKIRKLIPELEPK